MEEVDAALPYPHCTGHPWPLVSEELWEGRGSLASQMLAWPEGGKNLFWVVADLGDLF